MRLVSIPTWYVQTVTFRHAAQADSSVSVSHVCLCAIHSCSLYLPPRTIILTPTMHDCYLPPELMLQILDAAVLLQRDHDRSWSLSLSLVCRAVRSSIMPMLYEVLVLAIRPSGPASWSDRRLKFLSWLLHDREAAPRRHVRHLVFTHGGSFWLTPPESVFPEDVVQDLEEPEMANWYIEQLTVRYREDAKQLFDIGLRPRVINEVVPHVATRSESSHPVAALVRSALGIHDVTIPSRVRCWSWVGNERNKDDIGCIVHCILDPSADMQPKRLPRRREKNGERSRFVMLELGTSDGALPLTYVLLDDIANLLSTRLLRVTFSCDATYQVRGKTVEQFVKDAVPVLPPDLLHS